MKFINTIIGKSVYGVVILFVIQSFLFAQVVENYSMTRSKMWIRANPNGSLERETTMGNTWLLAYPGHWDNRNEAGGGWDAAFVWNVAQVAGEDVGWYYRNGPYDDPDIYAVEQTSLTKNYNLADPTSPEEYLTGIIGSNQFLNNKRHMRYELSGEIMGWSFPKYDDFLIVKCRLTNTDDAAFQNFYYVRSFTPEGPYRPSGVSSGWDVEYFWDADISEEIGFIFYDDTSLPPTGEPPIYTISPGDVTGNKGDPGNIATEGSKDYKLYSPSLYAFSFIKSSITANKNGEQKVWRVITSTSGSAPQEERPPSTFTEMNQWAFVDNFLQTKDQPKMNWIDARNQYQPGDLAGSLYERNPRYYYGIGPYDIAPGESIEWLEIILCGEMDRNITIRGGLSATTNFVSEGLQNLKDNWQAAQNIISNNYQIPAGEIPPPTPADQPNIGNDRELTVEEDSKLIGGSQTSGVNITWDPVHIGYTDPETGLSDFAGYRVYRSDTSVEGPWELVKTLSTSEADALIDAGKIIFFQSAIVGVPYRYCITSFDDSGNESAKTGFNHFPVAASFQASNSLKNILVIPNPFRQQSGFLDTEQNKRLAFVNIPSKCTIRIYTVALDLVKKIEHNGAGEATWGSTQGDNYMLTDFAQNVMPGIYIYHVESHVPGHEGESAVGKFAIIK